MCALLSTEELAQTMSLTVSGCIYNYLINLPSSNTRESLKRFMTVMQ